MVLSRFLIQQKTRSDDGKSEKLQSLVEYGPGNRLNQFDFPTYLCVDDNHNLYVSDRVMKWMKDTKEGINSHSLN